MRFFWYSAIITLPQTWRIVPLRYFYNYWYFIIWCHENPHQPRGSYPLEVSWYLIFLLYGGRIFPNLKGRILFRKDLRGTGDILPIWFHDSSPPNLKGRILPIWLSSVLSITFNILWWRPFYLGVPAYILYTIYYVYI